MTEDDQGQLLEEFKALRNQYKIGTSKLAWMLLEDLQESDVPYPDDDDDTDAWIYRLACDGLVTSIMLWRDASLLSDDEAGEDELPIPFPRRRPIH